MLSLLRFCDTINDTTQLISFISNSSLFPASFGYYRRICFLVFLIMTKIGKQSELTAALMIGMILIPQPKAMASLEDFGRIVELYRQSNYEQVLKEIAPWEKDNPTRPEGPDIEAMALRSLGRLPEAKIAATKAKQLGSTCADQLLANIRNMQIAPLIDSALKKTLTEPPDWQGAEMDYRNAVDIAPDLASLHSELASIFASQGRLDEARIEYTKATKLDASFRDPYSW